MKPKFHNTTALYKELQLLNLRQIEQYKLYLLIYNKYKNNLPESLIKLLLTNVEMALKSTRGNLKIHIGQCLNNMGLRTLNYRCFKLLENNNSNNKYIKKANFEEKNFEIVEVHNFKMQLKKWLLSSDIPIT